MLRHGVFGFLIPLDWLQCLKLYAEWANFRRLFGQQFLLTKRTGWLIHPKAQPLAEGPVARIADVGTGNGYVMFNLFPTRLSSSPANCWLCLVLCSSFPVLEQPVRSSSSLSFLARALCVTMSLLLRAPVLAANPADVVFHVATQEKTRGHLLHLLGLAIRT
jgi:hypothetical protein